MIKKIKKSFRNNLMLAFLSVAVLPLLITSIFLIQLFCVKLNADYKRQDSESINAVKNVINDQFMHYHEIINHICRNEEFIEILETENWARKIRLYNILYQETVDSREFAYFKVYDSKGICKLTTTSSSTKEDLPTYWGILRSAQTHTDQLAIAAAKDYDTESDLALRACKAIMDDDDNMIGYLVIDMTKDHFEKLLKGYYGNQTGISIVDSYWESIFNAGSAQDYNISQIMRNEIIHNQQLLREYNEFRIYSEDILGSACKLIYMRKKPFSSEMIKSMYLVMIVMTLISLVLSVLVAIIMSKKLTKPLSDLNDAMKEVEAGNLDIQIRENRDDEFGFVAERFNQMIQQLKENVNQKVMQQKELNDANIAMLHAQLNPHFLYNTLDTMKWLAKANGVPQLALMATKLAKILRMSISKEPFVTLNQELSFVNDYIEIQKIRYDEKFEYECKVPTELLDCIIPKQIIQPIVENAVLHGIGEIQDRKGMITVTVKEKQQALVIQITDNGDGIPDEVLLELNQKNREKLAGHIGFYNVDTIIQLNYGEKYGLHAKNLECGGTCITMILPINRGI